MRHYKGMFKFKTILIMNIHFLTVSLSVHPAGFVFPRSLPFSFSFLLLGSEILTILGYICTVKLK